MWNIVEFISPNTEEFEITPMICHTGFREYDARWLYPQQINLLGFQCMGAGLATQLREMGQDPPRVVVGHDYRSYSAVVKQSLIVGLLSAGCHVYDIGLAITPMAYFARKALGVSGVAMVTASHNENGWTGIKMGATPPFTHDPEEMLRLKEIVLGGVYDEGPGRYEFCPQIKEKYLDFLVGEVKLKRKIKAVVAAGNGTASIFGPCVLERIGCEVIPVHCTLDYTFPNYNPNPEDVSMLRQIKKAVLENKADIGLGFDGDGDRLGVVDSEGNELFSDKLGLLMARSFSKQHKNAKFIVDVKSTGLYVDDPVLMANGATTEYWITGHSYMKRRLHEAEGLAGFERSGHFFFADPIGAGYDDGILSAVQLCKILDDENTSLAEMRRSLRETFQSPTMGAKCSDLEKYHVVEGVKAYYEGLTTENKKVCGQTIDKLICVNGVRVMLNDGTWGLVRASSNKPSIVVVVESPVSNQRMHEMFREIDTRLRISGKVGEYDQDLDALEVK